MRRTWIVGAIALALAVSDPAWTQDSEPAPVANSEAANSEAATTSELPATASPTALLATGGALSLLAGSLLIRRRY